MEFEGVIILIEERRQIKGKITVNNGRIERIEENENVPDQYIIPGFIDAHIHIESAMLVPSEFAKEAVRHGTVATVSDPHEIANVCGVEGVEYMIENAKNVNFKFFFGAPSCVPATNFETSGATIGPDKIEYLLQKPEILYLAEMMNWPGVLFKDKTVVEKIALAKKYGKPIDGHAPGLKGKDASDYIQAGISTDHECFTLEEAKDKLEKGMKIIVREGSAAKNYEALSPLIDDNFASMMFCSDDKHPDELLLGHINKLVARSIAQGHDLYKVLQMACLNPIEHYNLPVGKLKEGDAADFIIVDNLRDFNVKTTLINGSVTFQEDKSLIPSVPISPINNFNIDPISIEQIQLKAKTNTVYAIEAIEGQLITNTVIASIGIDNNGNAVSNLEQDILKFIVVNRYATSPIAIGFIKNFGLQKGAIASSVGHDSHNILAIGVDDASLCDAVNMIIDKKGGISAVEAGKQKVMALPIAGIMSDLDANTTAEQYKDLDAMAKNLGSTLQAPYMTLSFMALLVIPQLKLSDKGLFDGQKFEFVDLFHEPENQDLSIVDNFYRSFAALESDKMTQFYHKDAKFYDPVFEHLDYKMVCSMWTMLIERSKGKLEITHSPPIKKGDVLHCVWEAKYKFSKTGRDIHNIIEAQIKIKNGKIIEHIDTFDAYKWIGMAFGWKGKLPLIKNMLYSKLKKASKAILLKYSENK